MTVCSGTEPIDTIDVIKNGQVVYSRRYLETQLSARAWVQVKLEAPAEVFNGHKNPRQARVWRGAIEVKGGRFDGVVIAVLGRRTGETLHAAREEVRQPGATRLTGRPDAYLFRY
jgi:hypothetical protein